MRHSSKERRAWFAAARRSRPPRPLPRQGCRSGAVRSPERIAQSWPPPAAILDEAGYAGFSMDALARRAHSSKPTIYRWWHNKAALIAWKFTKRRTRRRWPGPIPVRSRGDLIARLAKLWTWWEESRAGEALRSIIAEAQLDPATLDDLRNRFMPRREEFLRPVVDRAIARGEISGDFRRGYHRCPSSSV